MPLTPEQTQQVKDLRSQGKTNEEITAILNSSSQQPAQTSSAAHNLIYGGNQQAGYKPDKPVVGFGDDRYRSLSNSQALGAVAGAAQGFVDYSAGAASQIPKIWGNTAKFATDVTGGAMDLASNVPVVGNLLDPGKSSREALQKQIENSKLTGQKVSVTSDQLAMMNTKPSDIVRGAGNAYNQAMQGVSGAITGAGKNTGTFNTESWLGEAGKVGAEIAGFMVGNKAVGLASKAAKTGQVAKGVEEAATAIPRVEGAAKAIPALEEAATAGAKIGTTAETIAGAGAKAGTTASDAAGIAKGSKEWLLGNEIADKYGWTPQQFSGIRNLLNSGSANIDKVEKLILQSAKDTTVMGATTGKVEPQDYVKNALIDLATAGIGHWAKRGTIEKTKEVTQAMGQNLYPAYKTADYTDDVIENAYNMSLLTNNPRQMAKKAERTQELLFGREKQMLETTKPIQGSQLFTESQKTLNNIVDAGDFEEAKTYADRLTEYVKAGGSFSKEDHVILDGVKSNITKAQNLKLEMDQAQKTMDALNAKVSAGIKVDPAKLKTAQKNLEAFQTGFETAKADIKANIAGFSNIKTPLKGEEFRQFVKRGNKTNEKVLSGSGAESPTMAANKKVQLDVLRSANAGLKADPKWAIWGKDLEATYLVKDLAENLKKTAIRKGTPSLPKLLPAINSAIPAIGKWAKFGSQTLTK